MTWQKKATKGIYRTNKSIDTPTPASPCLIQQLAPGMRHVQQGWTPPFLCDSELSDVGARGAEDQAFCFRACPKIFRSVARSEKPADTAQRPEFFSLKKSAACPRHIMVSAETRATSSTAATRPQEPSTSQRYTGASSCTASTLISSTHPACRWPPAGRSGTQRQRVRLRAPT